MNWVLDADIQGFFDTINHEWLLKMIRRRIADKRVLRHFRKWLKAGVLEEGQWRGNETGTPQGAGLSHSKNQGDFGEKGDQSCVTFGADD